MTRPTLFFDYGGTLDTPARHWNYVLLDAYRDLSHQYPLLQQVEGNIWRSAYVHGERTLAQSPIINSADTFQTLLFKKIQIQIEHLSRQLQWNVSDDTRFSMITALASHCDVATRQTIVASRKVLDTLQKRGYPMVLVTNFYGNIHCVLKEYGLIDYFPLIIESAVEGVRKPNPAIWELALQRAGVSPQNAIAIGDAFSKDIVPAHQIGCSTIWIKGEEWEKQSHDESLPTHIVTSLQQLLSLLA